MPDTRPVQYTPHPIRDPELARHFTIVEAEPRGALRHAVAVPTGWTYLALLPIDPDPGAPTIASLFVESEELGDQSAVLLCGTLRGDAATTAREAVEHLAGREGLSPYRWNDAEATDDDARAMVSDEARIGGLRVRRDEGAWAFVSCIGPKSRLAEFGGAIQHGLESFRVYPPWARDA